MTPSLAPTTAPPTAATPTTTPPSGRYVNQVLGYTVTMPAPWRVSDCLSRIETRDPGFIGQDVLTWHTIAEEQDLGVSGGTGATGAFGWVILITAQVSSQTGAEYATSRSGGSAGQVVQATTIGGQPAARLSDPAGNTAVYDVASSGRIYEIRLIQGVDARPPVVTDATFDAIARSMTFMTPVARPTPTAQPAVTVAVETLADAVAAAFAASDADRLRALMTPNCWFNSGFNRSEGAAASRDKFAASLRSSFAQGLKVTVEPRPIRTGPLMPGSFWIWSTWSAHGTPPRTSPQSNVQLVFDQIDGRWYWVGALFNAER